MIDSKIGECIPSKIIRAGKAWHGLVEFVGYSSPRCPIDSMMITTRGGKRIPYPAPKNKMGKFFTVADVSPIACAYMHSSAKMETEDDSGTDWSGYAILQFGESHELLMIRVLQDFNDLFFMTPDSSGQAIPYALRNGGLGLNVYNPINLLSPLVRLSSVYDGSFVKETTPLGASLDGRTVYFSFVGIGSNVLGRYKESDPPDTSSVAAVVLSGDVVDGVSSVSAAPPQQVLTSDHSYANTADSYHLRSVLLYSDDNVPYISVEPSDVDPSNPYWLNIVGGYNSKTEDFSVHSFPYLDESSQPKFIKSTRAYTFHESYDGDHAVRPAGAGDDPQAVYVVSGHTNSEILENVSVDLDADGVTIANVTITGNYTQVSEMELFTRYNLNSVMVKPSRWVRQTGYISLTLDGVVVFSKNGFNWYDSLTTPPEIFFNWWPSSLTQKVPSVPGLGRTYRAVSLDGTRAAQVDVFATNFFCADILSIAVIIREGDIIPDHPDGIKVAEGTVTDTIHIGKCFARGVTLDDPITLDESEFGDRMYRAFDPIDRVITPVYKWPVFFQ